LIHSHVEHDGEGAAQHDPAFSTTRYVTFQVPSNGCACA
jgi:hypothetical protein